MGGNGSGRKSRFEESMLNDVLNLSLRTVKQFLEDMTIPIVKRVQIARDFGAKKVATKIEADINAEVTMMDTIKKNGKPVEHKVGDA